MAPNLASEDLPLYDAPRLPRLFDAVCAATSDAVTAIRQTIEREGWVPPSGHYPLLGHFDGGMPHVEFGVSQVPNYRSLLVTKDAEHSWETDMSKFASFETVLAEVKASPELVAKMSSPVEVAPELLGFVSLLLITNAWAMPLQLADRFLQMHGPDDELSQDAVLEDYLRLEASLVMDTLPVDLVLPVIATAAGSLDIAFDDDVYFVEMPELFNLSRVPAFQHEGTVNECLVSAATHAIVQTGVEVPYRSRFFNGILDPTNYDLQRALHAVTALRIATGFDCGVKQLVIRPVGWASTYQANLLPVMATTGLDWYPKSLEDGGWLKPTDPIEEDKLHRAGHVFRGLSSAHARVQLAARKFTDSVLRERADDALLDASTGFEALLAGESTEITYRLRMRAAALLQLHPDGGWNPQAISQWIRDIYKARSEVIHGSVRPPRPVTLANGDSIPVWVLAQLVLRDLLFMACSVPMFAEAADLGQLIDDQLLLPGAGLVAELARETAEDTDESEDPAEG